jgi:hypothetical protein
VAACFLFIGALPLSIGAQDWHAAIQEGLLKERVLGLLNLPEVVTADCIPTATAAPLRSGPSNTAALTGSLQHSEPCQLTVQRSGSSAGEALPTSESDYELPASIVLQREGPWFRIGTLDLPPHGVGRGDVEDTWHIGCHTASSSVASPPEPERSDRVP